MTHTHLEVSVPVSYSFTCRWKCRRIITGAEPEKKFHDHGVDIQFSGTQVCRLGVKKFRNSHKYRYNMEVTWRRRNFRRLVPCLLFFLSCLRPSSSGDQPIDVQVSILMLKWSVLIGWAIDFFKLAFLAATFLTFYSSFRHMWQSIDRKNELWFHVKMDNLFLLSVLKLVMEISRCRWKLNLSLPGPDTS